MKVPIEEKQMKKLSVLLACLLSAGLAHAGLVTYNFTASVTGLTEEYPGADDNHPSSSNYTGFTITVGDILHGTFTMDTSTPLLYSSPSGSGTYNSYNAAAGQNAFTAIFNSSSYTVSSTNEFATMVLSTLNQLPGQGHDNAGISTSRDLSTGGYEAFGVNFSDPSATALTYNQIPGSLSGFTDGTFQYRFTSGMAPHAIGLIVDGAVTSLTQVSAVPEPSSYLMLLAGIAAIAGVRRNRNTA